MLRSGTGWARGCATPGACRSAATSGTDMADYTFANAYAVDTSLSPAGKEQSGLFFSTVSLGAAQINDGTSGINFSGNDVSAVGLIIAGQTHYGWISRPIKSNGDVRGFYFWSDA